MATHAARVAVAALGGAAIYYVAVVVLGGILAAVAIPRAYFAFFGREHAAVALALLTFGTSALPVFLAVSAGAYAVIRAAGSSRAACLSAGLGMLACFAYYYVPSLASLLAQPESTLSFVQAAAFLIFPYWWALPGVLAPWLGLSLAIWLLKVRARVGIAREV